MAVSYSQLRSYRNCPKQYEFMAIKKIPHRITAGESFGSSVHNTLRRWGELEMAGSETAPIKRQLTLFTDEAHTPQHQALELTTLHTLWRECFIAEGHPSRAEKDACIARGDTLLAEFFTWWKSTPRSVVAIESGFKLNIPRKDNTEPFILSGRFDRIERTPEGLHVIDYKTGTPQSQADVDADLQLSIYAFAAAKEWKEPVAKLTLLFLGEDELIERTTLRSASQLKDTITSMQLLHAGINAHDFHPTPSIATCRHCPYREICTARAI